MTENPDREVVFTICGQSNGWFHSEEGDGDTGKAAQDSYDEALTKLATATPPSTNWLCSTAVYQQVLPKADTKYYPDPTDPRPLSIFADTHPAE
jgi:hypothetical protein